MAKLIYSAIVSLDGYVEDAHGRFGWAAPGEDVHAFVNELERPVGTYLYGRRMYEAMIFWEKARPADYQSPAVRDFISIWRTANKVVFSRTLDEVSSERTRIEREFDPERVRELKLTSDRDLTIGGAELAGQAIVAGLVDECQLLLVPVVVGGGKRALPNGVHAGLRLLDQRRFEDGVVFLSYRMQF
jgi:dihydrofolate reductase